MITRNNLSTQVGGDEKENNEEKLVRSFGLGGTCGLCFEHFRWSQPLSCRRGHCAMSFQNKHLKIKSLEKINYKKLFIILQEIFIKIFLLN